MMEGVSQEACSLAGHWGLGKLICFYDDNNISIDGSTEIAFTEDVAARFEALGWQARSFPPTIAAQQCRLCAICSAAAPWRANVIRRLAASAADSLLPTTDVHVAAALTRFACAELRSVGLQVLKVGDGNTDVDSIRKAIDAAKNETGKPSLIQVRRAAARPAWSCCICTADGAACYLCATFQSWQLQGTVARGGGVPTVCIYAALFDS